MATTPRYLATTVADAKTYVSAAMSSDVYLRVYDMDGDGAVSGSDETAFVRALARAETEVDESLSASHGAPFSADTFAALPAGAQDSIREIVLELMHWHAVKLRPSMSDEKKSPYRVLWKDARERLKELRLDFGRRLPGVAAPQPTPRAGVISGDEDDAGLQWSHLADGTTAI
jgi:hypothetical protein